MSERFVPEELQRLSKGKIARLPPCVQLLQGNPLEVDAGQKVTHLFPVSEQFTNAVGSMQGGFITAAFDNVFGHLGYMISAGRQIATLDINTTFIRPVFPGDQLRITVHLKHCGKTVAYMEGEAVNSEGHTIAFAQTHIIFLNE